MGINHRDFTGPQFIYRAYLNPKTSIYLHLLCADFIHTEYPFKFNFQNYFAPSIMGGDGLRWQPKVPLYV